MARSSSGKERTLRTTREATHACAMPAAGPRPNRARAAGRSGSAFGGSRARSGGSGAGNGRGRSASVNPIFPYPVCRTPPKACRLYDARKIPRGSPPAAKSATQAVEIGRAKARGRSRRAFVGRTRTAIPKAAPAASAAAGLLRARKASSTAARHQKVATASLIGWIPCPTRTGHAAKRSEPAADHASRKLELPAEKVKQQDRQDRRERRDEKRERAPSRRGSPRRPRGAGIRSGRREPSSRAAFRRRSRGG